MRRLGTFVGVVILQLAIVTVYVSEAWVLGFIMELFRVPFIGRVLQVVAFFKIAAAFGFLQWAFWHPKSFWQVMVTNTDGEEIRQLVLRGIVAYFMLGWVFCEFVFLNRIGHGVLIWARQYQLLGLYGNLLVFYIVLQLGVGLFVLICSPDMLLQIIRVVRWKISHRE